MIVAATQSDVNGVSPDTGETSLRIMLLKRSHRWPLMPIKIIWNALSWKASKSSLNYAGFLIAYRQPFSHSAPHPCASLLWRVRISVNSGFCFRRCNQVKEGKQFVGVWKKLDGEQVFSPNSSNIASFTSLLSDSQIYKF